jgi:hypothetical protein
MRGRTAPAAELARRKPAPPARFRALYEEYGVPESVIGGELPAVEQALALSALPLALAGNLAYAQTKIQRLTARPVLLLPLRAFMQKYGSARTISELVKLVSEAKNNLPVEIPLWLALDAWPAGAAENLQALAELLSAFRDAAAREGIGTPPRILGPSTREVQALAAPPGSNRLLHVLNTLYRSGVDNLAGGDDLDVHRSAAGIGFSLSFAHDLSYLSEGSFSANRTMSRRALSPLDDAEFEQPLFFERIVSELLQVRECLGERLAAWFPWLPYRFSGGEADPFSIPPAVLFRSISLARLVLGSRVRITAPLGALGSDIAEASLLFGANDLGFTAVDAATARALSLPRLSASEVVRPHGSQKRAAR